MNLSPTEMQMKGVLSPAQAVLLTEAEGGQISQARVGYWILPRAWSGQGSGAA